MTTVAAVDLGATSGRIMLGRIGHNELSLQPIARFPNAPVSDASGLHWDIEGPYESVLAGLTIALREEPTLASIDVDTWAVDYALLKGGRMLAPPFHYRDERRAERMNASTTGLVNVSTGEWDDALILRLGVPRGIFPELVTPGSSVGGLLPDVAADVTTPAQATAIVNVLVQARAQGAVHGDIESLRALVAAAFRPVTFSPNTSSSH